MSGKFDVSEAAKVASVIGTAFKVAKAVLAQKPLIPVIFGALPALAVLQGLKIEELPAEVTELDEADAMSLVKAFYAGAA